MEWTDEAPKEEGGWYVCVGWANGYLNHISDYGQVIKYGRSLYFCLNGYNHLISKIHGQWLGPLPMKPLTKYLREATRV